MNFQVLMAFLLALGSGQYGKAAGEQLRPSRSDDAEKVNGRDEEQTEGFLARLQERWQTMLDRQIAVSEGTRDLHRVIQGNPNRKPRPDDIQAALKLAAKQKEIVIEVTKVSDRLKGVDSAVVFNEVVHSLRQDMERLQQRLMNGDVGTDSQTLEQDIIETLRDMVTSHKRR